MTRVGSRASEGVGRAQGSECGLWAGRAAPGVRGVAMRFVLRFVFAGMCCAILAVGMIAWRTGLEGRGKTPQAVRGTSEAATSAANIGLETFPDPNAPGTSAQVFIDQSFFDAVIFDTALPFTGPIRDARSLEELREAVRGRGRRGIAALRAQYDQLRLDSPPTSNQAVQAIRLAQSIAFLEMHEGKLAEAASWLERALELSRRPEVSPEVPANLRALLGIAALRRGEIENCLECLGPSSCIFPIASEAVHVQQAGSREAV